MNLDNELYELQRLLAQKDLLTEPRSSRGNGFMEILLAKRKLMKIKIYQEKGHQRPHIHIDYGTHQHAASYDIETGERIEGNLPKKFDADICSWLERNHKKILEIWKALQTGAPHESLIAELAGGV